MLKTSPEKLLAAKWIAGVAAAGGIVSVPVMQFPLASLLAAIVVSLMVLGFRAGADRALGVGVLGALSASILIAPSGMGVPVYTGMAVGVGWLFIFAFTAWRRIRVPFTYKLFLVPACIGIIGSLFVPSTPFLPVLVALFTLVVGVFSGSLSGQDKRVLYQGLIVVGACEAGLCSYETLVTKAWSFGQADLWPHPLITGSVRAAGTLGHPLIAGMIMLVALGLLIASPWKPRLMKTLVLALLLLGIFSTGSMSVYITAGVCLLLPFAARRSARAHAVKVLLLLVGGLYLLLDDKSLAQVFSGVEALNSGHRLNTILAFPSLILDRPFGMSMFGTGWGTADQNYLSGYLVNDNFFAPDNQFVTVLMSTGIVGLTFFAAFLAAALRRTESGSRLALATLIIMFFSFDVLSWAPTGALFIALSVTSDLVASRKPEMGDGQSREPKASRDRRAAPRRTSHPGREISPAYSVAIVPTLQR